MISRKQNVIIQVIDDDSGELNKYYLQLGKHHASAKDYDMAHKFYMKGGQAKKVIEMYNEAGMWEEAHQLASRHLDTNEVGIKSSFHFIKFTPRYLNVSLKACTGKSNHKIPARFRNLVSACCQTRVCARSRVA